MDIAILFTAVFYTFCAFGAVFISCEVGQRISNGFEEIEDVTSQYHWYLFPEQLKRMLPMILINLQVPVGIPVFGSFLCSRDTFKRVRKTIKNPEYSKCTLLMRVYYLILPTTT